MKTAIALVLCFLFLLSFFITAQADEIQSYSLSEEISVAYGEEIWAPKGTVAQLLANYDNALRKGICQEPPSYTLDDLWMIGTSTNGDTACLGSSPRYFPSVNKHMPMCNLYLVSEKLICTAYRIQVPDTDPVIALFFFEPVDVPEYPEREYWHISRRIFFLQKLLPCTDFSCLKPGDPISLVEEIDPTTTFRLPTTEREFAHNQKLLGCDYTTYHYLKDALLRLDYEADLTGALRISKITFDPNYTLLSIDGVTGVSFNLFQNPENMIHIQQLLNADTAEPNSADSTETTAPSGRPETEYNARRRHQ